ncbi:MAG: DivIVA domain-containing protein [Oscillospiraceae bacterium]|nr:DivIVA domain-containing protein [Oscillospiraceae bacterium]
MLSVKDINNKRFEQARPGYKPEEVDDFLREIAHQITQYQKDKEETEKKIAVLVESVREYKKDEDALKDALIGAQKQGRAVIAEAQEQADKIIAEARIKADEIIGTTRVQLEKEKRCLVKMQQEVSDFKANLLNMYKQHLEQITAIPDYDDEDEEEVQETVTETVTEESVSSVAQEEVVAPKPEPQDMEATKVLESPFKSEKTAFPFDNAIAANSVKTENKFGELKFGQNK